MKMRFGNALMCGCVATRLEFGFRHVLEQKNDWPPFTRGIADDIVEGGGRLPLPVHEVVAVEHEIGVRGAVVCATPACNMQK